MNDMNIYLDRLNSKIGLTGPGIYSFEERINPMFFFLRKKNIVEDH